MGKLGCCVLSAAMLFGCDPKGACEDVGDNICHDQVKKSACIQLETGKPPKKFASGKGCPALGFSDNGGGGNFYAKWELEPHRNDKLGFSMKEPKGASRDRDTGGVAGDTEMFGWTVPRGAPRSPDEANHVAAMLCSVSVRGKSAGGAGSCDKSKLRPSDVTNLPNGFLVVGPASRAPEDVEVRSCYEGATKVGDASCTGPKDRAADMKAMLESLVTD